MVLDKSSKSETKDDGRHMTGSHPPPALVSITCVKNEEDIVEAFDYFFFNYQNAPLLVVKADDIDFSREEDVLDLLDQLRDMKKASLYYVPQSYGGKGPKRG